MNSRLNEWEKTLCALAQFVLMFAKVENAIVRTLQRLSKVSVEVAQAIFSGVRSEGAIQTLIESWKFPILLMTRIEKDLAGRSSNLGTSMT